MTALIAFILFIHLWSVIADYEHNCTADDYHYMGGYTQAQVCGDQLADIVTMQCAGGRRKRANSVFYDKEQANSFLRIKRSTHGGVGIVCECCVHDCTVAEFDQYCFWSRRKRSVRSAITNTADKQTAITEENVKKLYKNILNKPLTLPKAARSTEEEALTIQLLEANKRNNIKRKNAMLMRSEPAPMPEQNVDDVESEQKIRILEGNKRKNIARKHTNTLLGNGDDNELTENHRTSGLSIGRIIANAISNPRRHRHSTSG